MLLVSVRVSRPGQHPRARASYGFQPAVASPRLSCGISSTGGRGLGGTRTVRTKGTRGFKPKFYALYALTRGQFTLSVVVC